MTVLATEIDGHFILSRLTADCAFVNQDFFVIIYPIVSATLLAVHQSRPCAQRAPRLA
jgi:hypothetical protein